MWVLAWVSVELFWFEKICVYCLEWIVKYACWNVEYLWFCEYCGFDYKLPTIQLTKCFLILAAGSLRHAYNFIQANKVTSSHCHLYLFCCCCCFLFFIDWAFRLRWKKEKKKWSKKRETVSTWLLWFQYTFPVTDQRRHLIKPREKSLTPSPERGLPLRSKIVRSRLPEERTINFCWFKCNLVVIIILRKRLQHSLKLLLPSFRLGLVNEPSSRPRPHSSATALTVHLRK